MPVLGAGTSSVTPAPATLWAAAGPAYTHPRPASDLRMSTYDTGGTDSSSDLQSALNAAAAVAQTTGRARLLLDSRIRYDVGVAISQDASGCYGQLHLPFLAGRASHLPFCWLELVGVPGAGRTPLNYGAPVGTTIRSTLTAAPAWDGAKGIPSVLGGPASFSGKNDNQFSSVMLALDNVCIRQPTVPKLCGVDAGMLEGLEIGFAQFDSDDWASFPSAGWSGLTFNNQPCAIGLITPQLDNGFNTRIRSLIVAGHACAVYVGELMFAERIMALGCFCTLGVDTAPHPNVIELLEEDDCSNGISGYNPAAAAGAQLVAPQTSSRAKSGSAVNASPLQIVQWDIQDNNNEGPAGLNRNADVFDGNNVLALDARANRVQAGVGAQVGGFIVQTAGGSPTAPWNGRIIDLFRAPGVQTPPAMPASGTAIRNPFWRDALVQIAGGTVTAITVNGTATGQTSGAVLVPAGANVAITYSAAPSWTWQTM